jgi:hypothetical protein
MGKPLTFALLLAATSAPAWADQSVIAEIENAAERTTLQPQWTSRVEGGELVLQLHLANFGEVAADVVVGRGRLPGAWLAVEADGVALEQILTRSEQMESMSRMGPMPRFAALAPGKAVDIGTYRFALPKGQRPDTVRVVGSVSTATAPVELATTLALAPS